MSIDAGTVRRVAHLARIRVSDDEAEALRGELNAILGFVEQLNEVDVTGVEPMTSVQPMAMRKREEQLRGDEEAAERAAVEAEQVRRDYDATLAEARAEAARIIDEARQAAEAQRADIIRAAEDEVSAQRQEALAGLDAERSAALDSLRTQVAAIAVEAAGKVVQQPLDVGANQATVDAHVSSAGGAS